MNTVIPGKRRPDQNTGRRAKVVPGVETLPCPAGGLHELTNDAQARTFCEGCRAPWWALDAEVRAS